MKFNDLKQLTQIIKKEGNVLKHHFVDITQNEYDELKEDYLKTSGYTRTDGDSGVTPKKVSKTLEIEDFYYYSDLIFFIRIKDKKPK